MGEACVAAEMAAWKRLARGLFLHIRNIYNNDDDDRKRGTLHKPCSLRRILYGQFPSRIITDFI